MAGGLFGFGRDVLVGSPTDRSAQQAYQEAYRLQGQEIFDDLPPPPAPGVDPVTGIATKAVAGGYTVSQTRHLALLPDGGYREEKAGQYVGPRYPTTGPAPWPAHLPPENLLGAGYTCRPDGLGGITCTSVERPIGASDPAAVDAPGIVGGTIFDVSPDDYSRTVKQASGTPSASTGIYGNTERVFDDLQANAQTAAQQRDQLQAQLDAKDLQLVQLQQAQQEQAASAQQAAINQGATGTGEGGSQSAPPSPAVLVGVGALVLVGLVLLVW